MKTIAIASLTALLTVFVTPVQAEPTSGPVNIVRLRPYNCASCTGAVYVQIDAPSICDTTVYQIDLTFVGAKEVYAAALTAFVTGKKVQIEVVNTGCTGWGTKIQSLYVNELL
jgi:hypothetical protein